MLFISLSLSRRDHSIGGIVDQLYMNNLYNNEETVHKSSWTDLENIIASGNLNELVSFIQNTKISLKNIRFKVLFINITNIRYIMCIFKYLNSNFLFVTYRIKVILLCIWPFHIIIFRWYNSLLKRELISISKMM